MNVVYATSTGVLSTPDGTSQLVRTGTHWPADDPVVKANPGWFAADPRFGLSWTGEAPAEMNEPPVETATAAPGEKRTVRRG